MSILATFIQHSFGSPTHGNQRRKGIKLIHTGKEVQLSLLADDLILFMCPAYVLSCFNHVQLFAALWAINCQDLLSMGILQARILEWVIMPSSRDLPNPGTEPTSHVFCIGRCVLYH